MDLAVIEQKLTAKSLNELARRLGADDSGVVAVDDPMLAEDRPFILRAFPAARTLLVLLGRMHREPVRSPSRSIANLEFHSAGHAIDDTARAGLESMGHDVKQGGAFGGYQGGHHPRWPSPPPHAKS